MTVKRMIWIAVAGVLLLAALQVIVPVLMSVGGDGDAPGGNGYYAYVRFDSDTGPFADRDLPAVYIEKAENTTACFSGRENGQVHHVVIQKDAYGVQTLDPALPKDWISSNCEDALKFGSQVLTAREYLKVRLSLLPATPDYAAERAALEAR
jgi:hypothetical protein